MENQPISPVQPVEPVQPMPPARSRGPMIAAVVVGVLVLASAVFAYTKLANKPTETATPTPSVSSSATPDPTADWKTYTNTQYGFEMKLPSYWDGYTTDVTQLSDNSISIGFNFPYTSNGVKTYYNHALQIIIYPASIYPTIHLSDGSKPPKIGENSTYVYSYSIGQDLGGNIDLEKAARDMNQILDTFKLTSSGATDNWKTYTNAEYGFEFKYPATGNVRDLEDKIVISTTADTPMEGTGFTINIWLSPETPREGTSSTFAGRRAYLSKQSSHYGDDYQRIIIPGFTADADLVIDSGYGVIFDQILSTFRFTK